MVQCKPDVPPQLLCDDGNKEIHNTRVAFLGQRTSTTMTRIVLDAMGGDGGLVPNVTGALTAVVEHPELEVILVGHRGKIEELLAREGTSAHRIKVVGADGVAGMGERPIAALKKKRHCSIAMCWRLLKSGAADAVVSAGNTGAVVAASRHWMDDRRCVKRPAIAVSLPSRHGRILLLDAGANPSARPEHPPRVLVVGASGSEQRPG